MTSTDCARAIVAQLLTQGVSDAVLCPGSRSAPLAFALFDAQAAGLRLHVRVDERSAGFLALGLAKGSGRPVPIVTTSGTAAGNLLPAVMEAHHSHIGLLVVSADRPGSLIGTGANQTTDQVGIFGRFVRGGWRASSLDAPASWGASAARAWLAASGEFGAAGPAHLNVEFAEPLTPPPGAWDVRVGTPVAGPGPTVRQPVVLESGVRTVVVAGDAPPSVGAAAVAFAEAAGVPLLAEPSSNARRGSCALATGRLLLTELGDGIGRVVVFGHPTLSRPVSRLLRREDVEVVVVADGIDYPDAGWRATRVCGGVVPSDAGDRLWLERWRAADVKRLARVVEGTSGPGPITGVELARTVLGAVAEGQALVLGSSNAIRDADLAPIAAHPQPAYANRGLAGIDGTVSTALGIALATGRVTTLLCGDLTFLHDANGLLLGPPEPRPDLRIVVADDVGGSIFATLEQGAPEHSRAFERVFATPTTARPAAVAAALGVRVTPVTERAQLAAVLAAPISGLEVVVVAVDRASRRDLADRVAAADQTRPRWERRGAAAQPRSPGVWTAIRSPG